MTDSENKPTPHKNIAWSPQLEWKGEGMDFMVWKDEANAFKVPKPKWGIKSLSQYKDDLFHSSTFELAAVNLATGEHKKFKLNFSAEVLLHAYEPVHLVVEAFVNELDDKTIAPGLMELLEPAKPKYHLGGFIAGLPQSSSLPVKSELAILAESLPGIQRMVAHPLTGNKGTLYSVIMSLNDGHKWSREQIADWLDEISDPEDKDGPDLRFRPKSATLQRSADSFTAEDHLKNIKTMQAQTVIDFTLTSDQWHDLMKNTNITQEENNEQD